MIDKKADPNLIGGNEKRAINIAAWNGNVEVVQILLDHGADIDPDEDYWYGSAVGTASRYVTCYPEVVIVALLTIPQPGPRWSSEIVAFEGLEFHQGNGKLWVLFDMRSVC